MGTFYATIIYHLGLSAEPITRTIQADTWPDAMSEVSDYLCSQYLPPERVLSVSITQIS